MSVELWSFGRAIGSDVDLRGMSVEALDGGIGKVTDVVDQIGGAYLVVDTGPWIFGKTVTLPAGVVTAVDTSEGTVFIDRMKDDVKNAPEHDPSSGDDTAHHEALTAYYGAARESDATAVAGSAPSFSRTDDQPEPAPFGGLSEAEASEGSAWPSTTPDEGDASPTTPSGDLDTASPSSEAISSEPPPAAPEASEQPDADMAPASGSIAFERVGGAPADVPQSQPETVERSTDENTEEESGRSPKRRFTRETKSSPIAKYDSLTAAEVVARLRNLSQRELAEVERYEKRHQDRQTVLSRIESLREDEPWRGYDDATVDEVKKKLADADEARAKAVRDYERRHRDRKGVMGAARRTVASA